MKTLNAWGVRIDALLTRMQDMTEREKRLIDGLCYAVIATFGGTVVVAAVVMLSRVHR